MITTLNMGLHTPCLIYSTKPLVTATALINFGALVAFSFVNLSVIAQFWRREKRRRRLQYLPLPLVGVLTVGELWLNLEASSMTLGLC